MPVPLKAATLTPFTKLVFVPVMVTSRVVPCFADTGATPPQPMTVTVAVYVFVVKSSAVTVYITEEVKSCAAPLNGLTLANGDTVIVGVNDERLVPCGIVTAMVFAPMVVVPTCKGIVKLVISFAEERAITVNAPAQVTVSVPVVTVTSRAVAAAPALMVILATATVGDVTVVVLTVMPVPLKAATLTPFTKLVFVPVMVTSRVVPCFADVGATPPQPMAVTVAVYVFVVKSSAVTVYITGLVKFCATPLNGLTLANGDTVIVGVNDERLVPCGILTAMVFAPMVVEPT
jgi:hypothetical protein